MACSMQRLGWLRVVEHATHKREKEKKVLKE